MEKPESRSSLEYLSNIDGDLAFLINRYGPLSLSKSSDIYCDIVETIIGQMLSLKAGNTIAARVRQVVGTAYDPKKMMAISREELRQCGLSYAKADHLIGLAADVIMGRISFDHLDELDDDALIAYLMSVKGVGRWTAEMIALFSLGRPDIFSFLDVALKNGVMKAKGYKTLSWERFTRLHHRYSPYGSIASLYFYKCNDDVHFVRPDKRK